MEHLERIWIEIFQGSSASDLHHEQYVYRDILGVGDSHRLWNSSSDDTLRRVISCINSKLNDIQTREYGMVALCRFIEQVDPGRLVAIQDHLASSLHLSLKSLELETTHQFLGKLIQHCREIPELNQVVTSTGVPKILSTFCNSNRTPSKAELNLIWVCLTRYRGPCGNQRQNLENKLVSTLDFLEDSNQLKHICLVLPLISSAGGGGSSGMKHSEDWLGMIRKVMASVEDCLVLLLGDAVPAIITETMVGPRLALSACEEANVFQRISAIKNHLLKLITLLGHYLSDPFPAPKPVPLKSILNLVRKMLILDPLNILKAHVNPPKEHVYLSVVIPEIRYMGYILLQSLTLSVGSNIMTQASTVEELVLQELKWMAEHSAAFGKLKIGLYSFVLSYLDCTKNNIGEKTCAEWTKYLLSEIEIKRRMVELSQPRALRHNHQSKKKGSLQRGSKAETNVLSSILTSNGVEDILPSDPAVATLALTILTRLIHTMAASVHKLVHVSIGRLALNVFESESYPAPYDEKNCRRSLYRAVLSLVKNPNPLSPVSLSFFTELLSRTEFDPFSSEESYEIRSWLERVAHPIGPTLNFPVVIPAEEVRPEAENVNETRTPRVELLDNFCQTETCMEICSDQPYSLTPQPNLGDMKSGLAEVQIDQLVRIAVESTLKGFMDTKSPNATIRLGNTICSERVSPESDSDGECVFTSAVSSPHEPMPTDNSASLHKRKYTEMSSELPQGTNVLSHIFSTTTTTTHEPLDNAKRFRNAESSTDTDCQLSFESMLHDFVEV